MSMPEVTQGTLDKLCEVDRCQSCQQRMRVALSAPKTSGNSDKINSGFELAGGLFILLSILKVCLDQNVAGVSVLHVGFFAGWGYWNLYYYKAIQQRASFMASIGVTAANTIWLALLMYYR